MIPLLAMIIQAVLCRQCQCAWVIASCGILYSTTLFAHEDLDLGIESASFTKDCRINIAIKNYGHTLPDSFYHIRNSARVNFKKGKEKGVTQFLPLADTQQALKNIGGRIMIQSQKSYSNNSDPLSLAIMYGDEFSDYGTENDRLLRSVDCIMGEGEIAGTPIIHSKPDVAIRKAAINPKTCRISLRLVNLTNISMADRAWDPDKGVRLIRKNLDNHHRAQDISLTSIDPAMTFTRKSGALTWEVELPFPQASSIRLGIWHVPNDMDFSNNVVELTVPTQCKTLNNDLN